MKKDFKHTAQRGFTLIEVLIYIVLFGMLMSGAVVAAYQLLQGGERQHNAVVAEQEGTFVNRKLSWALTPATNVSISGGGKIMTITRSDMNIVVDGTGSQITFKRDARPTAALTSSGLALADVLFETVAPANGLPEAVHISFSIDSRQFTYGLYLRQ